MGGASGSKNKANPKCNNLAIYHLASRDHLKWMQNGLKLLTVNLERSAKILPLQTASNMLLVLILCETFSILVSF